MGLEHVEPNSGRRIGSLTINLGGLTGRKPTFRRGQIVYGYLRPYLNKVWVAEFDGYSSVDQFAFNVRPELADTEFVAAFMRSETFLRRSSIVTTTGQLPRIGTEQIAAVPIELPPLDVQRRIASDLAKQLAVADAARCAAAERLTAAATLPSAFLRDAFESEDFRRSASTVNFGSLVDSYDEMRVPVRSHDRKPGPYPYYGASGVIDSVDRFIFDGEYLLVAEDGANLVARATPIAFVAKGRFWVNNHAHVVKPKNDRLLTYLVHYLAWLDISRYVSGSAQPKLNQAALNALPVLVPLGDAAAGVAERLTERTETAAALVARCREELASVQSLPGTMLRNVFGEAS